MSDQKSKLDAWFKKFNSWDLSNEDFLRYSFDGKDDCDVVYTSPSGGELTRYMATQWHLNYKAYYTGWMACVENNGLKEHPHE